MPRCVRCAHLTQVCRSCNEYPSLPLAVTNTMVAATSVDARCNPFFPCDMRGRVPTLTASTFLALQTRYEGVPFNEAERRVHGPRLAPAGKRVGPARACRAELLPSAASSGNEKPPGAARHTGRFLMPRLVRLPHTERTGRLIVATVCPDVQVLGPSGRRRFLCGADSRVWWTLALGTRVGFQQRS
jgi:hypothetical protein